MSRYKKYINVSEEGKEYISYEINDIITDERIITFSDGDKLATNSYIQSKLKSLTGKILTIIDASIPEGKQNKCVKDLVRKDFLDMFREISEDLIDMKACCATANKAIEDGSIPEIVSAKEILGA